MKGKQVRGKGCTKNVSCSHYLQYCQLLKCLGNTLPLSPVQGCEITGENQPMHQPCSKQNMPVFLSRETESWIRKMCCHETCARARLGKDLASLWLWFITIIMPFFSLTTMLGMEIMVHSFMSLQELCVQTHRVRGTVKNESNNLCPSLSSSLCNSWLYVFQGSAPPIGDHKRGFGCTAK